MVVMLPIVTDNVGRGVGGDVTDYDSYYCCLKFLDILLFLLDCSVTTRPNLFEFIKVAVFHINIVYTSITIMVYNIVQY